MLCILLACRGSAAPSSPASQDRAGPSELQSFSDSLRSKLNSVSMRYFFLGNCGFSHNLCFVKSTYFDIYLIFYQDIRSQFQRVPGDGRKDCSLEVFPCLNLVLKLGVRWMLKLLVYPGWWNPLKLEKTIECIRRMVVQWQRWTTRAALKLEETTLHTTTILQLLVLLAHIQVEQFFVPVNASFLSISYLKVSFVLSLNRHNRIN